MLSLNRFYPLTAVLLTLLTACSGEQKRGEYPTDPSQAVNSSRGGVSLSTTAPTPGACSNYEDLKVKAIAAFGKTRPEYPIVIGKLVLLTDAVNAGNFAAGRSAGYDIIDYTVNVNRDAPLPGGAAAITTFLDTVACYAGLTFTVPDPDNSFVILPSDEPQIITTSDGLAGISFPANPVNEPTFIRANMIPFDQTVPGSGPLTTKLDQYKGFYNFEKVSDNNLPLAKPVIVAVCAPSTLNPVVLARLRLGHDASTGFEITPAAGGEFLNCDGAFASRGVQSRVSEFLGHVASVFTPRVAFAATTMFFGGGVGGTVTELSPFAPVDPEVGMSSGGVGGTVTELRIERLLNVMGASDCPTTVPLGPEVSPECRPNVTIRTPLGTLLRGAPVTFAVTAGGGAAAPQGASLACVPPFATSRVISTNALGVATACWNLGAVAGENVMTAIGGFGGDVPVGAQYAKKARFKVTTLAPTAMQFRVQPAIGGTVRAGASIPVSVAAVDAAGRTTPAFTGTITLRLSSGRFANGSTSATAAAVAGVATFPSVIINTAGTPYQVTATATVSGTARTVTSNSFSVTAGDAARITISAGNNQKGQSNQPLLINPTVRVADTFGNPVTGASVLWSVQTGGGAVSTSANTSGSVGTIFTRWTIRRGVNTMAARLSSGSASVTFTARSDDDR